MPGLLSEVTFGWCDLSTLLGQNLADLTIENWEEVEPAKEDLPLAIDWDHLLTLEKLGTYRVVAAHCGNELVGYDSFFVNRHTRHKNTTIAVGDVLYLIPEMRQGWTGVRQIRESDRLLQEAGVVQVRRGIQLGVEIGHAGTVGDLLAKLGYECAEETWVKLL